MLWKYKNALKLAKEYIKNPYYLLNNMNYSTGSHWHICFAHRLMGNGFKDVCPHYYTQELDDGPECSGCCDRCPYCGIIDFCADESGERSIKFYMDKAIVETFEETKNEKKV